MNIRVYTYYCRSDVRPCGSSLFCLSSVTIAFASMVAVLWRVATSMHRLGVSDLLSETSYLIYALKVSPVYIFTVELSTCSKCDLFTPTISIFVYYVIFPFTSDLNVVYSTF